MLRMLPAALTLVVERQAGVVSRQQLLGVGLTPSAAIQPVRAGRWQTLHAGIYATFTGPVSDLARLHAALLAAGPGAVAIAETSLWLSRFNDKPPDVLQIAIPHGRHIVAPRGTRVAQRVGLASQVQQASWPPRLRFEVALLDVTQTARREQAVMTSVLAAVQRRFTTVSRLRNELTRYPRHHWRGLLSELFSEAAEGVASTLELRYLKDVERAHRLPRGSRNHRRDTAAGRRYYDVYYEKWTTIAELDGHIAHPAYEAFRDWRRDNEAVLAGDVVLRYGWVDVVTQPCRIAHQVYEVLRSRGYAGSFARCSRCP